MSSLLLLFRSEEGEQGGITATLDVTEADDTLSAQGALAISAAASVTEAGDTLAASAALAISAAAAPQEADDSLTATAALAISATLAVTNEDTDTVSAAGGLAIAAALSIEEQGDTLESSATLQGGEEATAPAQRTGGGYHHRRPWPSRYRYRPPYGPPITAAVNVLEEDDFAESAATVREAPFRVRRRREQEVLH